MLPAPSPAIPEAVEEGDEEQGQQRCEGNLGLIPLRSGQVAAAAAGPFELGAVKAKPIDRVAVR